MKYHPLVYYCALASIPPSKSQNPVPEGLDPEIQQLVQENITSSSSNLWLIPKRPYHLQVIFTNCDLFKICNVFEKWMSSETFPFEFPSVKLLEEVEKDVER